MISCEFSLRYTGGLATSSNVAQFYDVSQAMVGFERTISLTTHLLLNGQVITQSPSAKGFALYALPAEEGSFLQKVILTLGGGTIGLIGAAGVAPPDSAFGWLAKSAVEYVIEETLGFEPNFEESLDDQIKRYRQREIGPPISDELSQERFDSLIEKVESGITSIHRPIVKSKSAEVAQIEYRVAGRQGRMDGYFSKETFDYVSRTVTSEDFSEYEGNISSYNTNTFKGRIFLPEQIRTVPFELSEGVRTLKTINLITGSLRRNGQNRAAGRLRSMPDILFEGLRNESVAGRLKSIWVTSVEEALDLV